MHKHLDGSLSMKEEGGRQKRSSANVGELIASGQKTFR